MGTCAFTVQPLEEGHGAPEGRQRQTFAAGGSLMSSTETVPHILSGLNPPAIASLHDLLNEATTTTAAPPAGEMATRDERMSIYGLPKINSVKVG